MPVISRIPSLESPERLWRFLKYAGLPRAGRDRVVRAIRRIRTPGETARRKALAAAVDRHSLPAPIEFLSHQGYHLFGSILAAERLLVTSELASLYHAARANAPTPSKSRKTEFLVTLRRDAEFLSHPAIIDFVSAQPFVEFIAAYFGEAGVLSSVNLWWSPANTTAQSSQLFHFDEADNRQLKFFLHISDVGPDNGPFSFIPAEQSARLEAIVGTRYGRFTDELVAAHVGDKALVRLQGGPGTFACVDTSRCLHYGSRGNLSDRVLLMFQYTRFSAPLAQSPIWGPALRPYLEHMSPIRRRAFQFT